MVYVGSDYVASEEKSFEVFIILVDLVSNDIV